MRDNQRTFQQDIRRKFIFFGLGPMLLIGMVAALLIYKAEESLIISEHTRLLRTVERLASDEYRRMHLLFNVIRNKIIQGDIDAVKEGFDLVPDLQSVIIFDRQGTVKQIFCRHHCQPEKFRIDPHQQELIRAIQQSDQPYMGRVHYNREHNTTLLSHAFTYQNNIYLINADTKSFFNQIGYYIQKRDERSLSIINAEGIYIYDSMHPSYVAEGRKFTQEGAYAAAVAQRDPYTLTEFPQHYKKGDSFWKGLFDNDHFLSYANISDFGWIVTVRDHTDAIDSYLQQVILFALLLMGATVALTIVTANMLARYIIVPVERLIHNINAFAQGKEDREQPDAIATYPIFKELLKSFQMMRTKIIAREQKLKEQIYENTQMRDKLIHQEKMAALGEMIGNIAHQWRQPLSVISTLATALKSEQELGILDERSIPRICTQINDNTQYLSNTIDDFRQFIKGESQKRDFQALALGKSLQNLLQVPFSRQQIELKISIEPSLIIHGYRNDLLQALINLLNNAKDALIEQGVEERYIHLEIVQTPDRKTVLRVTDNGGGIEEGFIKHLFEPYFTTKHKSQGTGLGLHMVHRLVVEGMQGDIQVKNVTVKYRGKSYRGAQFIITLPA